MNAKAPAAETSARGRENLRKFHEESLDSGLRDTTLVREIWPFLAPYRGYLVLSVVGIVASASLGLLRPLVMQRALDASLVEKDATEMMWGGAIIACLAVFEQLLGFAQTYAMQVLGARSMADLRLRVFRFLGELPLGFFDRQPVGRLVTRVTNDVDAVQELFSSGALSAIGDLIRLVGVVVLMLTLEAKLSLIAFVAMPLVGVMVLVVRRKAREAFRAIRGETARMNANMNEQVNGVALIQAFGKEASMASEFDGINRSYRDANMRSIKYDAIQDAAVDTVSAMSLASILAALGYHEASFGTVVALTMYLGQFFEPIGMLAQRYTLLQSALSGAERVFGLLRVEERDAPRSPDDVASNGDPGLALELERVTFAYKPGFDVLHDVSFFVRRGETVALVGPTGSGKTTITSLLLRLYEARLGVVRLGGRDLRCLSREEVRRSFAVVPQDVFLFSGTLAENVAAGETPDLDRVRAVFEQMDALDWFEARPGGLAAEVAAGGGNFSAGEKQMIAFARALYRDAPILVLDEATASIDSDTEAKLQRAQAALTRGRTSIVVAHRLSTVRAADRIVVLRKGHVAEEGSHEELLEKGGLYAALHELQFKSQKEPPAPPSPEVSVPETTTRR